MPVAVTIERAKKLLKFVTLDAGISMWIWGPAGVGKSSLVRQVAEDHDMACIDFRLSQIESSDLRGLPDRQDGRTVFLPPKTLPEPDTGRPGILFLDELNRASSDVLQAAFELVLDRKIGDYRLPDTWRVVVAGNFGDEYDVRQPDPALASRFCHLALATGPDYREEWVRYMQTQAQTGALNPGVVRVMTRFMHTGPQGHSGDTLVPGDHDLGGRAQMVRACPRTWEMLARIQSYMKHAEIEEYLYDIASGLIGTTLAGPYCEAARRQANLLTPQDLLDTRRFSELKGALKRAERDEIGALWRGLADLLKHTAPANERQEQIVVAFANYLVDDAFNNAGVDEGTAFLKDLVPGQDEDLSEDHPMLVWCRVLSANDALYAKMCRAMDKADWIEEKLEVPLAAAS